MSKFKVNPVDFIAVGYKVNSGRAVQDCLFESDFDRLLKQEPSYDT